MKCLAAIHRGARRLSAHLRVAAKRGNGAGMKIEFANPWFLLLLLLISPLAAWWLRRGRNALRHSAGQLGDWPVTLRVRLAQWGGVAIRTLALLLLIFALAGPRTPDLRTRIDTEGIAIVMVVDVSGS